MTVWYLEALFGIALSLSILMALAWMVQRRTGNSGWVATLRTFSLGLTGARSFRCIASMISSTRTAVAQSGDRFSEKVMLRMKNGVVT